MPVSRSNNQAILSLLLVACMLPAPQALGAQKPQYLPPEAPKVDTSVIQPAASAARPATAPEVVSAGDYGAASEAFQQPPDRVKDLLRQALEHHNQGDMSGAERLFHQVLTVDPGNADANFNLGAMSEDRGDLNGALKYYQAAARVNPNDGDVREAMSAVKDKLHQQQAAQLASKQLKENEQLRSLGQDAGAAYKSGHYDQAINDLRQVLAQDSNDPNALFGLAQAYRGKGDNARARQYLNQAVSQAPDNELYRSTLADLDRDMHQGPSPSGQIAGMPSTAPDYRNRGAHGSSAPGDYRGDYGASPDDQGQGLRSFTDNGYDLASDSGGQAGQLTPFTSQGEHQLQGHAYGSGYGGISMGGVGIGIGSAVGMGLLSAGLSRMAYRNSYYSGRGTRLMRGAVVGSLAGAAIGALTNMHSYGGAKAGAMRGGLTGGIMGLITGF